MGACLQGNRNNHNQQLRTYRSSPAQHRRAILDPTREDVRQQMRSMRLLRLLPVTPESITSHRYPKAPPPTPQLSATTTLLNLVRTQQQQRSPSLLAIILRNFATPENIPNVHSAHVTSAEYEPEELFSFTEDVTEQGLTQPCTVLEFMQRQQQQQHPPQQYAHSYQ